VPAAASEIWPVEGAGVRPSAGLPKITGKCQTARHRSAQPPELQVLDHYRACAKGRLAALPVTFTSACRLPSGYRPVLDRARTRVA
jgi:hypothetical protein